MPKIDGVKNLNFNDFFHASKKNDEIVSSAQGLDKAPAKIGFFGRLVHWVKTAGGSVRQINADTRDKFYSSIKDSFGKGVADACAKIFNRSGREALTAEEIQDVASYIAHDSTYNYYEGTRIVRKITAEGDEFRLKTLQDVRSEKLQKSGQSSDKAEVSEISKLERRVAAGNTWFDESKKNLQNIDELRVLMNLKKLGPED